MNATNGRLDSQDPLPGIVARIRESVQPSRIVLFGSRAAGGAQPDSDYDILVVLPGTIDRRAETLRVMRLFSGETVPIDFVVIGEEQLAAARSRLISVVRSALEHGRVLYAA